MIVIVGESASGKSSLQDALIEMNQKLHKVVTYTTRPKRPSEVDGVDYHFVSDDEFQKLVKSGFFVEHTTYRDWNYGTAKYDCLDLNAVAVLNPPGLRAIKRLGYNVVSIYLKVDRGSRLIKLIERGDNIEEAYRRNLTDVGQFAGVENEVDLTVNNWHYAMDVFEVADEVITWLEER